MIDYAKAQKLVTRYRSRLTRLQRTKDNQGIIDLWQAMQRDFDAINAPLPDCWHRWQIAADDAELALRRANPRDWLRA